MKKVGIIVAVIGLGATVAAGVVWYPFAAELLYQSSRYSLPQVVVLTQPSPSGKYVAKILHDERTKSYFLAIEGIDGTRLLLDRQFVPTVAHHEPIVNISWSDTETARVVVDHDFGEGNLVFEFNARTISFKQKP